MHISRLHREAIDSWIVVAARQFSCHADNIEVFCHNQHLELKMMKIIIR